MSIIKTLNIILRKRWGNFTSDFILKNRICLSYPAYWSFSLPLPHINNMQSISVSFWACSILLSLQSILMNCYFVCHPIICVVPLTSVTVEEKGIREFLCILYFFIFLLENISMFSGILSLFLKTNLKVFKFKRVDYICRQGILIIFYIVFS